MSHRGRAFRALWFVPLILSTLAAVFLQPLATPVSAQDLSEFPLTTTIRPSSIAAGPDGALWFTEYCQQIGRITTTGVISDFTFPTPQFGGCYDNSIGQIAAGPDGALWFNTSGNNQSGHSLIGRMTTSGVVTEFPVTSVNTGIGGITNGPDGALWFTEPNVQKIGRMTTTGTVTEFPIPNQFIGVPFAIITGSDGALWFVLNPNRIGRMTTQGVFSQFSLPAGGQATALAAGPDGAVWFTEGVNGGTGAGGSRVGRIAGGVVTEFVTPTANSAPWGIAAGPDGALWFTELGANKVGRVTTAGAITEFPIPSGANPAGPAGIVAGPDGAMWFTESGSGKIGRILTAPLATATPTLAPAGTPTVAPTPTHSASLTPAATPTSVTASVIGGKNMSITTNNTNSITINWNSGTVQTSYQVLRYGGGVFTTVATGLPASATTFTDSNPAPGMNCYAALPIGPSPQQFSDALCAITGFHSASGSPTSFTLRLNQAATGKLSWAGAVGGQDSFVTAILSPTFEMFPVDAPAMTKDLSTNGITCYAVGIMRNGNLAGYSDQLCALAGFTTLAP